MTTRRAHRTPRWLLPAVIGFVCGVAAATMLPHHVQRRAHAVDRAVGTDDPRPTDVPTIAPAADDRRPALTAPPPAPAPRAIAEALRRRSFIVPVQDVASASLIGSFDDPRGEGRPHEAIDIPAPRGTPVLAVDDGRVARLFTSEAGGLTVYQFDPTGNWVYYYAHLDGYASGLSDGVQVRQGQVIGYVGTTGNAPERLPHLHFAIMRLTAEGRWWEGTAIDPYPLLRATTD